MAIFLATGQKVDFQALNQPFQRLLSEDIVCFLESPGDVSETVLNTVSIYTQSRIN